MNGNLRDRDGWAVASVGNAAGGERGDVDVAEQQPEPTRLERWVGESGWLVDLLLPSTDAGVLAQGLVLGVVFCLLLLPARWLGVVQLWAGAVVFTAGLFVLPGAH